MTICKSLNQFLSNPTAYTVLYFQNIGLNDNDAVKLADALKENQTVTNLFLNRNKIGDKGATAIGQMLPHNQTLSMVSLCQNQVGDEGASAIAQGLAQNNKVTQLSMYQNKINGAGAIAIGQMLPHNQTLKILSLQQNKIDCKGASTLGEGLAQNQTLKTLSLQKNCISNQGAIDLIKEFAYNKTLVTLSLQGNQIDEEVVYNLKKQVFNLGKNLNINDQSVPEKKQEAAPQEQNNIESKPIDQPNLARENHTGDDSAVKASPNSKPLQDPKREIKQARNAQKAKIQETKKEQIEEFSPVVDKQLMTVFSINNSDIEIDESILHKVRNLVKEGEDHLQNIEEKGIMLLGEASSGKSTLAHLLSNRKLQAIRDDETFAMVIDTLQPLSETNIPDRYVNGDVVIWDCPSINDTAGIAQEIANSFYMQKLFEKNKQLKFVFVISDSALIDNKGNGFVKAVNQLSKMFNNSDVLESSTSLVVTKAPSGKQPTHVIKSIDRTLEQNHNITAESRKIIEILKHSIHLFHAPTIEGELPNLDMLGDINDKTLYIESNPKFANMAISDDAMLHSKYLLEIVKAKFNDLLNVFVSAIVNSNDSIKPGSENNIFEQKYDLIKDWISNSMDYKEVKAINPEPFLNLKLLAFLREGLIIESPGALEEILPIFQRVLSIFEEFIPETETNGPELKCKIQEYSYTLLQQIDCIKFFSKLCGEENISNYGKEALDIVNKCYSIINDNFNYQLRTIKLESNQNENYYKVILKYLDQEKHIDSEDCLNLKSETLRHLGKIAENEKNNSTALEYYIKSISAYPRNPDAYNTAGDLFAKQGKYDEAILFYKIVNNSIEIKECFKKWLELEPKNPDIMIKRADYLASIGVFDKAKTYYNYALGLSKNDEVKADIAKKISNIISKKFEISSHYHEMAVNHSFYNYDLVNEEFMNWLPSLLGDVDE